MIEPIHKQRDADTQHIPIETLQRIQRIVLEETQGGRRIIRNIVAIMDGNVPACTPWHQMEAAKLLLKLGFEDAREVLTSARSKREQTKNSDVPSADGGQNPPTENPEHEKLNKKLVRQIRVDTHDGTTMVKFLIDVVEGNEPAARVRDRIEAAKVLLHLCFDNPAQPDPEFMMYYAPCHPDCLCVCKDLDEDHPEVVQSHTPPTEEQREQWASEAEMMERAAESAALKAAQKARAEKDWQLQQYHSPDTVEERRLEREELRKKRERERNRSP